MARASGGAGLKSDRRLFLTSSGWTYKKIQKPNMETEKIGNGARGEGMNKEVRGKEERSCVPKKKTYKFGDREDREWEWYGRGWRGERVRRSGARMKEIVYRQLSAIMTICVITRFISIPFKLPGRDAALNAARWPSI